MSILQKATNSGEFRTMPCSVWPANQQVYNLNQIQKLVPKYAGKKTVKWYTGRSKTKCRRQDHQELQICNVCETQMSVEMRKIQFYRSAFAGQCYMPTLISTTTSLHMLTFTTTTTSTTQYSSLAHKSTSQHTCTINTN